MQPAIPEHIVIDASGDGAIYYIFDFYWAVSMNYMYVTAYQRIYKMSDRLHQSCTVDLSV